MLKEHKIYSPAAFHSFQLLHPITWKRKVIEHFALGEEVIKNGKRTGKRLPARIGGKYQKIHTPFSLCHETVNELKKYIDLQSSSILVFNIEWIVVLIEDFGVLARNITFVADSEMKRELGQKLYNVTDCRDVTVIGKEVDIMPKIKKQFDVVLMNPPYQPPAEGFGKTNGTAKSIYGSFVLLALDILNDDGHLGAIHPPKWRRPKDALWEQLGPGMIYLEIHSKGDGKKTFGATTRYDWYVWSKGNSDQAQITDMLGGDYSLDLNLWPFLPNSHFNEVRKILAKEGEETCNILYSYTAYPTNIPKPWMSKTKDSKYRYPCVAGTGKNGIKYVYTNKKGEYFGIPKVIFGDGDRISNVIVDWEGNYGFTPHAMGIPIKSKNEGEKMKQALESDDFNAIIQACKWSTFQIDYRLFKYFREDFWREFI